MSQPEYVRPLLDLSTAHLPESVPFFGDVRSEVHEYGYIVWVSYDPHDDNMDEGVAVWLKPILKLAREHNCVLILFDRDASTIDGLKTWNW